MKTQTARSVGIQNRGEQFLLGHGQPPARPVADKTQAGSGAMGVGRKKGRQRGIIPGGLGIEDPPQNFAEDARAPAVRSTYRPSQNRLSAMRLGTSPPLRVIDTACSGVGDEAELTLGL